MAEMDLRETAKIYDLTAFRRARATPRVTVVTKPAAAPNFGGGAWYHDAAIREDDRPRRS